MTIFRNILFAVVIAFCMVSCKAKKEVAKTPAPKTEEVVMKDPPAKNLSDTPKYKPSMLPIGPGTVKPDYNFDNIQFEFNSAILKTGSIEILDHVAAAMKKNTKLTFVLNGNSSAEGSSQHNMELSVQRAAAVKTYLINSGIDGRNLTVKGWGESKPLVSNATESGRAKNRRVEIKLDGVN